MASNSGHFWYRRELFPKRIYRAKENKGKFLPPGRLHFDFVMTALGDVINVRPHFQLTFKSVPSGVAFSAGSFPFIVPLTECPLCHPCPASSLEGSFVSQSIRITSEEVSCHDLTGFRLTVVKNAALNLLEAGGYQMEDAGDCWIHFTTNSSTRGGEEGAMLKVLCAPVVNSLTRTKEVDMTCEGLRKLRLHDMEANSENKNVDSQLLDSLVDGSIKLTFLQVKSTQAVLLEPGTGSKGGAFLQYNGARMAALRRKYRELADEGLYPEMAEPEEVDFDLLKEPEEWGLLFNFLLEYPSLISRTAKEMASGKSNVHQICVFLSKLCSLFSVYYRRVRILLEPRDHLFRTIQARLLLAMSVEQVLENGLTILNIKKIEEM